MKNKQEIFLKYIIYFSFAFIFLFLNDAMAAEGSNEQQPYFKKLLENDHFRKAIDLGLLIFAGLKWYDYFNGFQPDNAFKAIITPGVLTYIAFNWLEFLGFVGLVK